MFHETYDNIIGVDVASKKLDMADKRSGKHSTIENNGSAVSQFAIKIAKRKSRTLVVMEATGGYERSLVDSLHDAGVDCAVINPLRVRQFAKGCGMLEKSDQIDARIIAHFGSVVPPCLSITS